MLSTAPFAPTLPVTVPSPANINLPLPSPAVVVTAPVSVTPSAKAKIEPFLFKATGANTLAKNVMGFLLRYL